MALNKEILKSIMTYCAYQERSEYEVVTKLKTLIIKAKKDDLMPENNNMLDNYIKELKSNGFLDKNRFLEAYVRGKVNLKKWGKIKISAGLRKHRVYEDIDKHIDKKIYYKNLKQLAEKKWMSINHNRQNKQLTIDKLYRYLFNKGYDLEEIDKVCDGLS